MARLWAQRKSVFDANNAETERHQGLRRQVGQDKLDAHLTAMRDVEKRLVGMTGTGTDARRTDLHASRRCPPTST